MPPSAWQIRHRGKEHFPCRGYTHRPSPQILHGLAKGQQVRRARARVVAPHRRQERKGGGHGNPAQQDPAASFGRRSGDTELRRRERASERGVEDPYRGQSDRSSIRPAPGGPDAGLNQPVGDREMEPEHRPPSPLLPEASPLFGRYGGRPIGRKTFRCLGHATESYKVGRWTASETTRAHRTS